MSLKDRYNELGSCLSCNAMITPGDNSLTCLVCKKCLHFECHQVPPSNFEKSRESFKCVFCQENSQSPPEIGCNLGWFGTRHYVTILLFFGMANAYTMRTNMSVAIVAMVNHTALPKNTEELLTNECPGTNWTSPDSSEAAMSDGPYVWSKTAQSWVLGSFFLGYVVTQIPFGILAKKYGSTLILGWGMMFNSIMGLIVPLATTYGGLNGIIAVRFLQGLGEGPIVPCSHALLSKWIPPNERSRMGAIVYSGAQFGTVISMPISGLLSHSYGGWPTIFYFFGAISAIWSALFIWTVYEDPNQKPKMDPVEKKYINESIWGTKEVEVQKTPYRAILTSMPFYAILIAHMGQNFGYETLMTELPTFMREILHFDIKENGILSSVPYFSMWMFSMVASCVADHFITSGTSRTLVRKIACAIGHFGPGICLITASYTGCNPYLTVVILSIGVGLNGAAYSGFKVNHMDISPRFAGILMSFTNCTANVTGLLAPLLAGKLVEGRPTQEAWREVFFASSGVYFVFCAFYLVFASAEKQPWDSNRNSEDREIHDIDETVH